MAAARVTDRPFRSGLEGVRKRRCLEYPCKTYLFASVPRRQMRKSYCQPQIRQNPVKQSLFGGSMDNSPNGYLYTNEHCSQIDVHANEPLNETYKYWDFHMYPEIVRSPDKNKQANRLTRVQLWNVWLHKRSTQHINN